MLVISSARLLYSILHPPPSLLWIADIRSHITIHLSCGWKTKRPTMDLYSVIKPNAVVEWNYEFLVWRFGFWLLNTSAVCETTGRNAKSRTTKIKKKVKSFTIGLSVVIDQRLQEVSFSIVCSGWRWPSAVWVWTNQWKNKWQELPFLANRYLTGFACRQLLSVPSHRQITGYIYILNQVWCPRAVNSFSESTIIVPWNNRLSIKDPIKE